MIVVGTLQQAIQKRLDADDLKVLSADRVSPDLAKLTISPAERGIGWHYYLKHPDRPQLRVIYYSTARV